VHSYTHDENRARTVAKANALDRTLERPPWPLLLRAHGRRAPLAEVHAAMHGPPLDPASCDRCQRSSCGRIELVATFVNGLPMADGLALEHSSIVAPPVYVSIRSGLYLSKRWIAWRRRGERSFFPALAVYSTAIFFNIF